MDRDSDSLKEVCQCQNKIMSAPLESLSILPAEIWCQVFKHLDNKSLLFSSARVCKDWNEIIRFDPKFGSFLILHENLTYFEAEEIIKRWPKLKTVLFYGEYNEEDGTETENVSSLIWKQIRNTSQRMFETVIFSVKKPLKWLIDQGVTRRQAFHCKEFLIKLKDLQDQKSPLLSAYPRWLIETDCFLEPNEADRVVDYWEECSNEDHLEELDTLEFCTSSDEMCKIKWMAPKLRFIEYYGGKGHEEAFCVASQFCLELEEIKLSGSSYKEKTGRSEMKIHISRHSGSLVNFHANKYEFANLRKFSAAEFTITLPTNWQNLAILDLEHCEIKDGWMQLPLAFPSLQELHISCKDTDYIHGSPSTVIHNSERIECGKKQLSDFFTIFTCIPKFKRLNKFGWKTLLENYSTDGKNPWKRVLRQQGHDILEAYLSKLSLDCEAMINLNVKDSTCGPGPLMKFSKKGRELAWRTFQWTSSDLDCEGYPDCICNDVQIVHEVIDFVKEEEPNNKRAKLA